VNSSAAAGIHDQQALPVSWFLSRTVASISSTVIAISPEAPRTRPNASPAPVFGITYDYPITVKLSYQPASVGP